MPPWFRVVMIVLGVLALLVVVGPFLVPVPPLEGVVDPRQLAAEDPDSRYLRVGGYDLHYREMGQDTSPSEPPLLLLHGFGGSTYTWRKVMAPLARGRRVIAFDRIGSGLSQHPMPGEGPGDWEGRSPYAPSAQPAFVTGLMDALGIRRAVLVGNSQGGTVALQTALAYPDRVAALVLADPAVYTAGGPPPWLGWLWATPQMRRIGPLAPRQFLSPRNLDQLLPRVWHDPSRFTAEERAGASRYLRVRDWDRSLWEYTVANEPLEVAPRLGELRLPVLVVAGDDDRIVPTPEHVRLAGEIPRAKLVVIPACGHIPQEEQPAAFLAAVESFLAASVK